MMDANISGNGRRPPHSQPLSLVDIDGALLTIETVLKLTGLGRTKLYKLIASGDFPERVYVGGRVRFRAEEIRVWNARRALRPAIPTHQPNPKGTRKGAKGDA